MNVFERVFEEYDGFFECYIDEIMFDMHDLKLILEDCRKNTPERLTIVFKSCEHAVFNNIRTIKSDKEDVVSNYIEIDEMIVEYGEKIRVYIDTNHTASTDDHAIEIICNDIEFEKIATIKE